MRPGQKVVPIGTAIRGWLHPISLMNASIKPIFSLTPSAVISAGTLFKDVCSVTWTIPSPCGDRTDGPGGR